MEDGARGLLRCSRTSRVFPQYRDPRPRTSKTGVSGNHHSVSPSTASPPSRTAKTARAPNRQENSLSSAPLSYPNPEAWEPGRKVAKKERRDSERDEPIASN